MSQALWRRKLIVAFGFLIAMSATCQVGLSHERYELTKEMTSARHEQKDLMAEMNRLSLELASLTRPERIRKLAKSQLGMAPPTPMQVIQP
ncbi:MAG: cell division protein FtsL [Mariprofundaceae bacterium]